METFPEFIWPQLTFLKTQIPFKNISKKTIKPQKSSTHLCYWTNYVVLYIKSWLTLSFLRFFFLQPSTKRQGLRSGPQWFQSSSPTQDESPRQAHQLQVQPEGHQVQEVAGKAIQLPGAADGKGRDHLSCASVSQSVLQGLLFLSL